MLEPLILNQESNIASYNIHAVTEIAKCLSLNIDKLVCSSKYKTHSTSNERLCDLTLKVDGNTYLFGDGADEYLRDDIFLQRGVKLHYQNFRHPVYKQHLQTEFISGLSIIDALMNLNYLGVAKLLRTTK